jgi:hypothetical protein
LAEKPRVRYRYTGDGGSYLSGVPARDLTEEDVALLSTEQKAAVRTSDLYKSAERDAAGEKDT